MTILLTNQLIVACVAAPSGYSVVCLEHQSKGYQNGYSYQSIKLSSFICVAQAGKNNFHQRALHAIPSILRPSNRLSKKNSKPSTGKKKKLQREWILLSSVGVRNTDHNSNDTAFRVPSAVERCQIEYRTVPKWPLLLGGNAPLVRFHSDTAEGLPVNTFTPLR